MKSLHVTLSRVLFVAVCATASAAVPDLPNFQKVNDTLYRGGQPTGEGFKQIAKLGVKTVIDLRLPGEHSQADEQKWVTSSGMKYVSVPLHGMSAPTESDVTKILAIINDQSAGPVFVHCRRGADRTGTIIACYRISHDRWENKKALSEARGYGMSWTERAMMHYVKNYTVPAPTADAAVAATVQQQ